MTTPPQTILITGASSGIGKALAVSYAQRGKTLILIGRDAHRLENAAAECRSFGATVEIGAVDVRDSEKIREFILKMDERYIVDLLIANAGVSAVVSEGEIIESAEMATTIFEINILGVVNVVQTILPQMCARGKGQIALMGSMAAVRSLPHAPAYCATKAAVHLYAESLRGSLSKRGVSMTLIIPGFVDTPFNAQLSSPKPMALSAERAAAVIQRGLEEGKREIVFPRLLYFAIRAGSLLPTRLVDAFLTRIPVETRKTTLS
ncbi:SDR family NAD(P)-dependent oxidoreductase [Methylocystis sp.]|uniref:SDR family NAD(P)-dependent oxidoreductase n=1 Tax=Methylocystis sp. TaxID=1911079 RepID=UPI003DA3586A